MLAFIAVIHVIIALVLIVLVLLQDSKGGAMGMLGGGGGSNSVLGTSAPNFLVKVTRVVAIIFAATCISLAYMTTQKDSSVLDDYVAPASSDGADAMMQPLETKETPNEAKAGTDQKGSEDLEKSPKEGETEMSDKDSKTEK